MHAREPIGDILLTLLSIGGLWWGIGLCIRSLYRAPAIDRLLATAVAGFTIIIISMQVLSFAGSMHRTGVATVSAAVLVVGLAMCAWRGTANHVRAMVPSESIPESEPVASRRTNAFCAIVALLFTSWATLYFLLHGLVLPVEPVSDAPIYHLYFAIRWWQSQQIELVPTPFGEEGASYFPANGDLWLAWLTIATQGAAAIKVGQWPFIILGGVALYGLSRQSAAPREASVYPSLCWMCFPLVLVQSSLANIDLIWSAFYFSAAFFAVRWWRGRSAAGQSAVLELLLFALSAGIVLGTKSVGLLFVPLLVVPVLIKVVCSPQRLRNVALLAGGLLVPCAYWIARNIYLTGNPVYPLQVSVLGCTVFPGWFDRAAMYATTYHVSAKEWHYGLPAAVAPAIATIAGLMFGVWSLARRKGTGGVAWASIVALAHVALFWWVIPYNTQDRFLLPALGLGLLPLAALVGSRWWLHVPAAGLLVWSVLSITPVTRNPLCLDEAWRALVIPVSLVLSALAICWKRRVGWLLAAGIVALGCVVACQPISRQLSGQPFRFYPFRGFARDLLQGWLLIEGQTAGRTGVRVAYAGTNLPYYLHGIHLANEVRYVNVNAHRHWLPHDYHLARFKLGVTRAASTPWPQWYRRELDYNAWVENLRDAKVEFLFVARENQHGRLWNKPGSPPFPIERHWADQHPELFKDLGPYAVPAGKIPWVRVYRLKSG